MPFSLLAMLHCRRLLLGLVLCVPSVASAACAVTLRWDDDPPYSMQLADGEVVGIAIDSVRSVLQSMGCEARLVRLPWARALRELEQGRLDILTGAYRKPEREVYAHFSGVVEEASRNILFMRRDAAARWPVSELLQLRDTPFRLGAQLEVSYGPGYQELIQTPAFHARMKFSANRLNLWRMAAKGRIDGVIADEHSGLQELKELGLSELIRPTPVVVSSEGVEVAFSKKSVQPEFVQMYAEVLRQQIADGTQARIRQHYLQP
jgi:polar amino acid transport system substrate-binding protein